MAVVAKFYVGDVKTISSSVCVTLYAATSGDENKSWAKYTPTGSVNLTIDNPAASDQFKQGDEFMVNFTKVEKENANG